jgi:hypothetical protein
MGVMRNGTKEVDHPGLWGMLMELDVMCIFPLPTRE